MSNCAKMMEGKNMLAIKKRLLETCEAYVARRIRTAREAMEAAQDAANEETKSSAGDKYETTREMMQQERDKSAAQLAEAVKLRDRLSQISPSALHGQAQLGSVVVTSQGRYFLSISMGKISLDGQDYFALAPNAPLGKVLLGAQKGESVAFNGRSFEVKEVG